MPANALVLLAEGAEEMETVIVVDVLRHKFFLKIIQDFQLCTGEVVSRWCWQGLQALLLLSALARSHLVST